MSWRGKITNKQKQTKHFSFRSLDLLGESCVSRRRRRLIIIIINCEWDKRCPALFYYRAPRTFKFCRQNFSSSKKKILVLVIFKKVKFLHQPEDRHTHTHKVLDSRARRFPTEQISAYISHPAVCARRWIERESFRGELARGICYARDARAKLWTAGLVVATTPGLRADALIRRVVALSHTPLSLSLTVSPTLYHPPPPPNDDLPNPCTCKEQPTLPFDTLLTKKERK